MAEHTLKKIKYEDYDVQVESAVRDGVGHNIADHIGSTSNPHGVTKTQVGLGNVLNVTTVSEPTSGSNNNITSGGVYTALSNKMNKASNITTGHIAEFSDTMNLQDGGYSVSELIAVAEGASPRYALSYAPITGYANASFNSTASSFELSSTDKLKVTNKAGQLVDITVGDMVNLTDIKVTETAENIPDRYLLKQITGGVTHYYFMASNGKEDHSWGVLASTFTTAGDIIVGTGNGTYARLGRGTNGQVLRSNGSTLEWVTVSATDTWRNIQVNSAEILGPSTSTGALNFVNGTNTTVVSNGNQIRINATVTTYSVFTNSANGLAPMVTGNTEGTTASDYVLGSNGKWIAKGLISGFTATNVTLEW